MLGKTGSVLKPEEVTPGLKPHFSQFRKDYGTTKSRAPSHISLEFSRMFYKTGPQRKGATTGRRSLSGLRGGWWWDGAVLGAEIGDQLGDLCVG